MSYFNMVVESAKKLVQVTIWLVNTIFALYTVYPWVWFAGMLLAAGGVGLGYLLLHHLLRKDKIKRLRHYEAQYVWQSGVKLIFSLLLALIIGWMLKRMIWLPAAGTKLNEGMSVLSYALAAAALLILFFWIKDSIIYYKTKGKVWRSFARALIFAGLLYITMLIVYQAAWVHILNVSLLLGLLQFSTEMKIARKAMTELTPAEVELLLMSDEEVQVEELLFPTRKKDLSRIKHYIEDISYNEPFAIAIHAPWGQGKSSILKVLLAQLTSSGAAGTRVIYIKPLVMDTREKLIEHFFDRLSVLLSEQGVYTGRGSPYKDYVELVGKLLDDKKINAFTGLFPVFGDDGKKDLREVKQQLEADISQMLGKRKKDRLFIVLDDFDRVEEATMRESLMFIKEIVDFKRCVVMFLMHPEHMQAEKINTAYMDKFIGKTFDLHQVPYQEMIHFFAETYGMLLNKNWAMQIVIDEANKLKADIGSRFSQIQDHLQQLMSEQRDELQRLASQKGKDAEKSNQEKQIEQLQAEHDIITERIHNPRRVKRFLREIRESLNYLHDTYQNQDNSYLYQNWESLKLHEIVFNAVFIKMMLEDRHAELMKSGSITDFMKSSKSGLVLYLLRMVRETNRIPEKQERIVSLYHELVFHQESSHAFNEEMKSEAQLLIEKLEQMAERSDPASEEQLSQFITAVKSRRGSDGELETKKRLERITAIIFRQCDEGRLRLQDAIGWLDGNYISSDVLALDIGYLEQISKRLGRMNLVFRDRMERETCRRKMDIKDDLFLSFAAHFPIVAWLYRFEERPRLDAVRNSFVNCDTVNQLIDMYVEFIENDELIHEIIDQWDQQLTKLDKLISFMLKYAEDHLDEAEVQDAIVYCREKMSLFVRLYEQSDYIQEQLDEAVISNPFDRRETIISVSSAVSESQKLQAYLDNDGNITPDLYERFADIVLNLEAFTHNNRIKPEEIEEVEQVIPMLTTMYNQLQSHWSHDMYKEYLWHVTRLRWKELNHNLAAFHKEEEPVS